MKIKVENCDKLEGTIEISGSKNTALPIICGALLTNKKVILENVPCIEDVNNIISIIKEIGCNVKRKKGKLIIKAKKFNPIILSSKVQLLRASYYLMGISLSRYNKCITYMPGGCNLGKRSIDFHLKAFEDIGYEIITYNQIIKIEKKYEVSNIIVLPKQSVGATINILFASFKNKNVIIKNPSLEPEVLEVIEFLKLLGCDINIKDNTIFFNGTKQNKKAYFKIINDRIEAGSYMLLATAIPNSKVVIENAPIKYMENTLKIIKELGSKILIKNEKIIIEGSKIINNVNLEIKEYPFFPTDLQQILTVVLLRANEQSILTDKIYPKRISHILELKKLDANVELIDNKIYINPSVVNSGNVIAKDLRCGFALIIAGCISKEFIIINEFEILSRGYENLLEKLRNIGVNIEEYNL